MDQLIHYSPHDPVVIHYFFRLLDHKFTLEKWPCDPNAMVNSPRAWSVESFQLAVDKAYSIKPYQKPDQNYQAMVQDVVKQRIAIAGCRLAQVFNDVVLSRSRS